MHILTCSETLRGSYTATFVNRRTSSYERPSRSAKERKSPRLCSYNISSRSMKKPSSVAFSFPLSLSMPGKNLVAFVV